MSQTALRACFAYGFMNMLEVLAGSENRSENWEAGENPALPPQR
jgi:hypothetical protein